MTLERDLRHYYHSISSYLPCSTRLKKRILCEIRENVSMYRQDFPDADFSQIKAHFGLPQTIAASYIDDLDTPELLNALRIRKKIVSLVIGALLFVLLMWGIVVTAAYIQCVSVTNGFVESYIVED